MKIETRETVKEIVTTQDVLIVEPGDIVQWVSGQGRYMASDHDTWIALRPNGAVEDLHDGGHSTGREWSVDNPPFRFLSPTPR